MKIHLISAVLAAMLLAGCSDSDKKTPVAPSTSAVTGEYHSIQPEDVTAYVAEFEAQHRRVGLALDGVQQGIAFVELDEEGNTMAFSYNDDENTLVLLGFDSDEHEPLPSVQIISFNDDDTLNFHRIGEGSDIQLALSSEADFLYSGVVTDVASQASFNILVTINESALTGGTSTLEVSGTDAILNGTLGTQTYVQMRDMIAANPNVTRVIIEESDGSMNDDINVHTGRLIRDARLATHVPADGDINSGAVDLFAAGHTRTAEDGAIVGVHSWCCNDDGLAGDELPRADEAHGTQLTYFRQMLPSTGEDFYFFTLSAASFDGIHKMNREEMDQYGLLTP